MEVEFPSFVSIGKPNFVQVLKYDKEREDAVRQDRIKKVQQRLLKHTGFRWVFEALAGGDLSELEPTEFQNIIISSAAVEAKYPLKEFTERLKQSVKEHQPVLVGHNLFADLVNFCNCFVGPLPDSVEDFAAMAHQLFPVVVDTKYLATHDCGSINPKSSLEEINNDLLKIGRPKIGEAIPLTKHVSRSMFANLHSRGS